MASVTNRRVRASATIAGVLVLGYIGVGHGSAATNTATVPSSTTTTTVRLSECPDPTIGARAKVATIRRVDYLISVWQAQAKDFDRLLVAATVGRSSNVSAIRAQRRDLLTDLSGVATLKRKIQLDKTFDRPGICLISN
jgi:hypothetical protein